VRRPLPVVVLQVAVVPPAVAVPELLRQAMEAWLAEYQKEQGQPQLSNGKPSQGKDKGKGKGKGPKEKKRRLADGDAQAPLVAAVLAVGDLAAETARSDRLLRGALMRTFLTAPTSALDTPLSVSNNAQKADQQGLATWAALAAALAKMPSSEFTESAIQILKAHVSNPCKGWQSFVNFARVAETFDGKRVKIQLWVDSDLDSECRAMSRILVAEGAELMFGSPPKTAKERKALQCLAELRAM
jgi:hypothetical protein